MFTLLCHTSFGAPGPVEGLPLPGPTFLKVDFFFFSLPPRPHSQFTEVWAPSPLAEVIF